MTVRLHQLEGFFYTGLTGGYTRAAEAMPYPISEPAVYQQVRKLERSLGIPLVETVKGRKVALTPEGRALHDFVAPFFRGLEGALDRVRRSEAARLTIALDGRIGCALASRAVERLRAKRPHAFVHLLDGDSLAVAKAVTLGAADVGLGILGLAPRDELEERPLLHVRVALWVPEGHALAKRRKPISPAELSGVPLCVYDRTQPGRAILERAFSAAGLELTVAAEASSVETLRALVRAGVGPAFIPLTEPARKGARPRKARDGVVAFDVTGLVPGDPVRYGLVLRPGTGRRALVAEVCELLVEAAGKLDELSSA